jgi:hypothetical protein
VPSNEIALSCPRSVKCHKPASVIAVTLAFYSTKWIVHAEAPLSAVGLQPSTSMSCGSSTVSQRVGFLEVRGQIEEGTHSRTPTSDGAVAILENGIAELVDEKGTAARCDTAEESVAQIVRLMLKCVRIVQEITSATSHVGVGNRCVVQVG